MDLTNITYHPIAVYNQVDPTRTVSLRNAFARDMRKRFMKVALEIASAIVKEDIFGLNNIHTFQTPGNQAFAFRRSEDKVARFMQWLQSQVDAGILEVGELHQIGVGVNDHWTNKYIFDSYKRGVMRARYEMQKSGMTVPTIEETGGIEISMGTPFHIDRLGLLYTRVFSDLKGITTAMDAQISRILTQGIADGDNPRPLARKLVATINGTGMGDLSLTDSLGRFVPAQRRAEILARTEIIRAHHQATIQEYMNWRVSGVMVQAEVMTAGDKRVCSRCEILAKGGPYSLEEAMNMIPDHPQCRCVALPFLIKK